METALVPPPVMRPVWPPMAPIAPAVPAKPKVKLTSATRRGLALVAQLARDSFDQNIAPSETVYARWTKAQQREYAQGLAWIDQNNPAMPGEEA